MHIKRPLILGLVVTFGIAVVLPAFAGEFAEVKRITTEELRQVLDDPSTIVLDARTVKDWRKSDVMIKGAQRVDPHDVSSWVSKYPRDGRMVAYCA